MNSIPRSLPLFVLVDFTLIHPYPLVSCEAIYTHGLLYITSQNTKRSFAMSEGEKSGVLPGGAVHETEEAMFDSSSRHQKSDTRIGDEQEEEDREEHLTQIATTTTEDDDDYEGSSSDGTGNVMGKDDRQELVRLATTLTRRHSTVGGVLPPIGITPSQGEELYDPAFDPGHESFDLRRWVKRFINQMREQGIAENARTGVSWKHLDVYGSGSALQLQATLWSVLSTPLRVGELFSFGKKAPKQILHSFDGIIEPGELLIVLGRPGSGCSTLLKSITGELHGLELSKESDVNYSGIPLAQMSKEFRGEAIYNQEVCSHVYLQDFQRSSHRGRGRGRGHILTNTPPLG